MSSYLFLNQVSSINYLEHDIFQNSLKYYDKKRKIFVFAKTMAFEFKNRMIRKKSVCLTIINFVETYFPYQVITLNMKSYYASKQ